MSDESAPPVSTPRPAATVILLRDTSNTIEVLMTRRHADLAFMGGLWVFPGGTVSASDISDAAMASIGDPSAVTCARLRDLQGTALSQRECMGFAIAACRETFEETGMLLATHAHGPPCDAGLLARLQSQRAQVCDDPQRFIELLAGARLRLDVSRLIYWAHWVTPSRVPRRFDTHFFAVAAPASQPVTADQRETSEYLWMSPAALIAAAQRGDMQISQPTLFNLLDLQISLDTCTALRDLFAQEATRAVAPVLPKMVCGPSGRTMILPWDAEYASAAGEGVAADFSYREAVRGLPSRMSVERPVAPPAKIP